MMAAEVKSPVQRRIGRLGMPTQWGLLTGLSLVFAVLLEWVGIPAALLLGPLLAGVIIGTHDGTIRVPSLPYMAGQAVVGCLIASVITPQIVQTFSVQWPLFVSVVLAIVGASSILGWLMSRWQVLPGSTAIWGSAPGGASAMMVMAEAFGADARLVAFMQYLRVVFVAVAASLIARFWSDGSGTGAPLPTINWFAVIHPLPLAETLAVMVVGAIAGLKLRVPAGAMLGPLILGTLLHVTGLITIELPETVLALSYALIGWTIGLRFTRTIVVYASRALPRIALAIFLLMGFCGFLAFILVKTLGVSPLTAYLATSPGGMDSVAIIATSTRVDVPFVMALQAVRFMVVLFLGPPLARFFARRSPHSD